MFHNTYFVENIHLLKWVAFNFFYIWLDYRNRRKKHNLVQKNFLIMTLDLTSTQPLRAVVEITFNLAMDREKNI